MLIRRALVEAVGHFDEQFFAYWEDVDYSLRSIRAGYHNIVVSENEVRHAPGIHETGLSAKPPHFFYYMARNELLLTRKHVGWYLATLPGARDFRNDFNRLDCPAAQHEQVRRFLAGQQDNRSGTAA